MKNNDSVFLINGCGLGYLTTVWNLPYQVKTQAIRLEKKNCSFQLVYSSSWLIIISDKVMAIHSCNHWLAMPQQFSKSVTLMILPQWFFWLSVFNKTQCKNERCFELVTYWHSQIVLSNKYFIWTHNIPINQDTVLCLLYFIHTQNKLCHVVCIKTNPHS